jgi:hypothetical protein
LISAQVGVVKGWGKLEVGWRWLRNVEKQVNRYGEGFKNEGFLVPD